MPNLILQREEKMTKHLFYVTLILAMPLNMASKAHHAGKTLEVPLKMQQTRMWCWATSTQMILAYMGKQITQCEQVNLRLNRSDCCGETTPRRCIRGGWPRFYHYGFSSDSTNSALPWSQLQAEIDGGRPVAFSWKWKKGGGHMMVATGYAEPHWVYVNDPWPPNGDSELEEGQHMIITYSEYVSSATHDHWRDYYNINPKPEVIETPHVTTTENPEFAQTEDPVEVVSSQSPVSESTPADSETGEGTANGFVAYDQPPEPVGGFGVIPRYLKYPERARQTGFQGKVVINVLVDRNGDVAATKVLESSGHPSLDQAAIDAITRVKWKPALQRDQPVKVWVGVPVSFKIR